VKTAYRNLAIFREISPKVLTKKRQSGKIFNKGLARTTEIVARTTEIVARTEERVWTERKGLF